jgi:hypothetical protein
LAIITPNGGETWPIGSTQTIQWNPAGVKGKVKIELSRNDGGPWEVLFGSTANDGTQNWKVTGPTTSKAQVQVSSINTPTIKDTSDGMFTIGGGSVTVVAPNGGETWPIGSTQTIRWSSTGLSGKVKIEISRDGGTNCSPLFNNVTNTGSKTWKVTKPTTMQARICVSSKCDPSVFDTSDGDFRVK